MSGSIEPTVLNRARALQARLPGDAFFIGITAAIVMRIPLPTRLESSPVIHVAVPHPRTALTGRYIHGRSLGCEPEDVRMWSGLRISSPERAWCEIAHRLSLEELVAAGDFLIHHRLPISTPARLEGRLERWGARPGASLLRKALPLLNERSESPTESMLRVIIVLSDLPAVEANYPITTSGGFDYRADLVFLEKKVIVEYQSGFHDSVERRRADMTRRSRLEADGWVVIEVNADDLRDPKELVLRIARILASR